MNRRDLLITTAALSVPAILTSRAFAQGLGMTGQARPGLEAVDDWAKSFMETNRIPGAALAISHQGKVVYARGFGMAETETGTPVQPDSVFRIGSISKAITGIAVLRLMQDGKLSLDDKVLDYFPVKLLPPKGKPFDERWKQITIAECLDHTGGWDREKSFDPMLGNDIRIAKALGVPLPINPQLIMLYQLGQPLDFDPGTRYAYSNFGYSILGRVIEAVTGRPYEDHIKEVIFKPLGLDSMQIGGTLLSERLPNEVRYYSINDQKATAVVGPQAGKAEVPINYGGWQERTLDSHGGFVGTAIDVVKLGAAFDYVDGGTGGGILSAETTRLMLTPHATVSPAKDGAPLQSYGYGWMLAGEGDKIIARHSGVLPGTGAMLLHFPGGTNLAFLANIGQAPDGAFIGRMVEKPLTQLVQGIKEMPPPL